jgi:hypothetical protein
LSWASNFARASNALQDARLMIASALEDLVQNAA